MMFTAAFRSWAAATSNPVQGRGSVGSPGRAGCVAMVILCSSVWATSTAEASIEGQAYNVFVITSQDGLEDETYTFAAGGVFLATGGTGTWTEQDLIILSAFNATYDDSGTNPATVQGIVLFNAFTFGTGVRGDGTTTVFLGSRAASAPARSGRGRR
jgi:hypothetical protein